MQPWVPCLTNQPTGSSLHFPRSWDRLSLCLEQVESAKSPDKASSDKGSFSSLARGMAQFPAGTVGCCSLQDLHHYLIKKEKNLLFLLQPYVCLHNTWINTVFSHNHTMDVRTFRPGKSPGKKGMSSQNIFNCWYTNLLINYSHFIHNPPLALRNKSTFNKPILGSL